MLLTESGSVFTDSRHFIVRTGMTEDASSV